MTNLAALLDTWQRWSAHNVMAQTLGQALAGKPVVTALDALRDGNELVELLTEWQWQAIYAARRDGASWEQIAYIKRTTVERVRFEYEAVLSRQETVLGRDASIYRGML